MAMTKKGFIMEMFAFLIIGILVILFFGILIYGFNYINAVMSNTSLDVNGVNITAVTSKTMTPLSNGMGNLRIMAIVMIFGYIFATFIAAYFSSKHPLWLFPYILISILLIIFSVYIANAYESIQSNSAISSMVTGFSASEFIVLHLPVFMAVISLGGILISIIGITLSRRVFEE